MSSGRDEEENLLIQSDHCQVGHRHTHLELESFVTNRTEIKNEAGRRGQGRGRGERRRERKEGGRGEE